MIANCLICWFATAAIHGQSRSMGLILTERSLPNVPRVSMSSFQAGKRRVFGRVVLPGRGFLGKKLHCLIDRQHMNEERVG